MTKTVNVMVASMATSMVALGVCLAILMSPPVAQVPYPNLSDSLARVAFAQR